MTTQVPGVKPLCRLCTYSISERIADRLAIIQLASAKSKFRIKKWRAIDGGGGLHNARLFVAAVRLGCGR
jgi:hypothetical protein